MTFVGIRGPIHDDAETPGVRLDDQDPPADKRDDAAPDHSIPGGRGAAVDAVDTAAPAQTPAVRPPVLATPNAPAPASDGQEVIPEGVVQPPAERAASGAKPKQAAPPAPSKKASEDEEVGTFIVSGEVVAEGDGDIIVVEDHESVRTILPEPEEPTVIDHLKDFVGHFRPFRATMAPRPFPELEGVTPGQTPLPERLEQLTPKRLPPGMFQALAEPQTEPEPEVLPASEIQAEAEPEAMAG
ncbi:hypothetical protein [Streptomyces sp. NPDC054849]